MKGVIKKIHPIKRSRNGNSFIRVEFKMEDSSWAKTDLCPDFINYQRWKPLLKVGNDLDGLKFKGKMEINADSFPFPVKKEEFQEWQQMPDGSMKLVDKAFQQEPLETIKMPEQLLLKL